MKRIALFLLIFFIILGFAGCYTLIWLFGPSNFNCDGIAFNFIMVAEDVGDKTTAIDGFLNLSMTLMKCQVESISPEQTNSDLLKYRQEMLSKYDITIYNASISCDLTNFTYLFYFKETSMYLYRMGMGPCGKENVRFIGENKSNEYETQSRESALERFEEEILASKKGDYEFCMAMTEKDSEHYSEDGCLFDYAEKLGREDTTQVLDICDRINKSHFYSVSQCYENAIKDYILSKNEGYYDVKSQTDYISQETRETIIEICDRYFENAADDSPSEPSSCHRWDIKRSELWVPKSLKGYKSLEDWCLKSKYFWFYDCNNGSYYETSIQFIGMGQNVFIDKVGKYLGSCEWYDNSCPWDCEPTLNEGTYNACVVGKDASYCQLLTEEEKRSECIDAFAHAHINTN